MPPLFFFPPLNEIFRLVSHCSYIKTLKIIIKKWKKNHTNEISSPTVLQNSSFNIKLTVQITYSILCVCKRVCVYGVYIKYEILWCTHHVAKNVPNLRNSMRAVMRRRNLSLLYCSFSHPMYWGQNEPEHCLLRSEPAALAGILREDFSSNYGEGSFPCHGSLSFI